MTLDQIREWVKTEETLEKILEELKPDIDKVEEWRELIKLGVVSNTVECKKALAELTGAYMALFPAYCIVATETKEREIKTFYEMKFNHDKEGKTDEKGKPIKFVAGTAEQTSKYENLAWSKIEGILEGYCKACDSGKISMQSILKSEDALNGLNKRIEQ